MTVRMAAMRRGSGAVTAAVLTALLVAACGGGGDSEEGDSSVAPSSSVNAGGATSESTPETETPESLAIDEVDVSDGSYRYWYGSSVWTKDCGSNFRDLENIPKSAQLFDSGLGVFKKIVFADIPEGEEPISSWCTATGTSASPTLTRVLQTRTPSSGLEGEKFNTTMVTYDIEGTIVERSDLDYEMWGGGYWNNIEGVGGNVLVSREQDLFLMTLGGDILADHESGVSFEAQVINPDIYVIDTTYPMEGWRIIYSGKNGAPVGGDGDLVTSPVEYVGQYGSGPKTTPLFDSGSVDGNVYTDFNHEGIGYYIDNNSVDRWSAESATFSYYSSADSRAYKVTDFSIRDIPQRVLISDDFAYMYDHSNGFKVVNFRTGDVQIEKTAEEWDALNVGAFTVVGKFLYVQGADNSSVIDVTTNTVVSDRSNVQSVRTLGNGWTLVSDFDDSQKIVRTPNGYEGPWY